MFTYIFKNLYVCLKLFNKVSCSFKNLLEFVKLIYLLTTYNLMVELIKFIVPYVFLLFIVKYYVFFPKIKLENHILKILFLTIS